MCNAIFCEAKQSGLRRSPATPARAGALLLMKKLMIRAHAGGCRLAERQTKTGGLNGRPEKLQDVRPRVVALPSLHSPLSALLPRPHLPNATLAQNDFRRKNKKRDRSALLLARGSGLWGFPVSVLRCDGP